MMYWYKLQLYQKKLTSVKGPGRGGIHFPAARTWEINCETMHAREIRSKAKSSVSRKTNLGKYQISFIKAKLSHVFVPTAVGGTTGYFLGGGRELAKGGGGGLAGYG